MAFSSLLFIFAFLPLFLVAYFMTPNAHRNLTALVGSLLFYAWGAPRFLAILLVVSWVDYSIGWKIYRSVPGTKARKRWVTFGVIINLSMLFYFKYSNFLSTEVNELSRRWAGNDWIHWGHVVMPIGISFVVFEEISYLVDIYRERSEPAKKFSTYALFLFLFPHSIAGPIFRWRDLEGQLISRRHSVDLAFDGVIRFLFGLGKKVLIADRMAAVADVVFRQAPFSMPASYAWIGIVAYSLQIYFDFSGYSDMAIGIGAILGFKFKENFNAPYLATSITDFWRRWHISLSTWMRDYLYIPLGGNQVSVKRMYLNLWIVFLLSGFWHGANWTFIAWGAYHGFWLILDRTFLGTHVFSRMPRWFNIGATWLTVMVGWVLFRSETIGYAWDYLRRLFCYDGTLAALTNAVSRGELISNRGMLAMGLGIAICVLPYFPRIALMMTDFMEGGKPTHQVPIFRFVCAFAVFVLVSLSLVTSNFSPFIYFRF